MLTRSIKISASVTYINIAVNVFFGLILTPLLITKLGQTDYGLYVMTGGIIALLATFDFGLSATITRFLTKYIIDDDKRGAVDFLKTIQTVFVILYAILLTVGITYILVNRSNQILSLSELESSKALVLICILLACLPAIMQSKVYAAICNGHESFLFPRLMDLVKYILRFFILVIALQQTVDSVGVVVIELILNVIFLFVHSYFVRFHLGVKIRLGFIDKLLLVKLLKYTCWVFIYALAMQFYWQIGQVAVGSSFSLEMVTIFSVGVMLGTYAGTFVTAFASMLLPAATRLVSAGEGPDRVFASCLSIGKINTGILFFIIGGFYLVGERFIGLWLGEGVDSKAIWLVGILIMAAYTIPLSQSFINTILDAKGLVRFKAILYLILLPSSIFFSSKYLSDTNIIIFVSGMIMFWVLAQIIMNFYYYQVLRINVLEFFRIVYGPWLIIIFLSVVIVSLCARTAEVTWFNLALESLAFSCVYGVFSFMNYSVEQTKVSLT